MMVLRRFAACVLIVLSLSAYGKTTPEKSSPAKTKNSMTDILDNFISLKKFLVSDEEFQDPHNAAEISTYLKNLDRAVQKTAHDPILNQENFKFSREVLEDHIHETERVFRLGNKSYARWMMNSTLGVCMSCHTQVPTTDREFTVFLRSDYFTSEFDKADFMFATKNFEGANQVYKSIVAGYPKIYYSSDKLEKSVQRDLIYQIRVKRDLLTAKQDVNDFLKNDKLPDFLVRNLKTWRDQLSLWITDGLPNIQDMKPKKIIEFAQAKTELTQNPFNSSDPLYISNLVVSGMLYDYLQKNSKSSITPDALYMLALIDRKLNYSIFYSLPDMYLKECILKFPENPIAMKCYREYEEEMIFGYTGSMGTNIPQEVLEDLKFLKNYVTSKGKSPLQRKAP
jgi:hypothetical protein